MNKNGVEPLVTDETSKRTNSDRAASEPRVVVEVLLRKWFRF